MDLAEIREIKTGRLGIWRTENFLPVNPHKFLCSAQEKKEFLAIKNNQRKKEFLIIRLLLQEMTGTKQEILYDQHGKPGLKNSSFHVSISHSSSLVVVLLTKGKAGVDTENIRRKTVNIAPRFLSEEELQAMKQSGNPQLYGIMHWCAKEAAFKYFGRSEMDFKNHIAIFPFQIQPEEGQFYGELRKEKPSVALTFSYFFFANNVIVYCVEEL